MTSTGPFKVNQGHRYWYLSKARIMGLSISELTPYVVKFLSYRHVVLVKLSLLTGGAFLS